MLFRISFTCESLKQRSNRRGNAITLSRGTLRRPHALLSEPSPPTFGRAGPMATSIRFHVSDHRVWVGTQRRRSWVSRMVLCALSAFVSVACLASLYTVPYSYGDVAGVLQPAVSDSGRSFPPHTERKRPESTGGWRIARNDQSVLRILESLDARRAILYSASDSVIVLRGEMRYWQGYGILFRDRFANTRGNVRFVFQDSAKKQFAPIPNGTIGVLVKCISRLRPRQCLTDDEYSGLHPNVRVSVIAGLSTQVRYGKDMFCNDVNAALQGFVPSSLTAGGPLHDIPDPRRYSFPCFVLPVDRARLVASVEAGTWASDQRWIIKPASLHSGINISLAETTDALLRQTATISAEPSQYNEKSVAQLMLHPPFLLDGLKFDLRVYALVTSISPLRVYVYDGGYARFAAHPYNVDGGRNITQYITNWMVNINFFKNADDITWTFERLKTRMAADGHDVDAAFGRVHSAVARYFLGLEASVRRRPTIEPAQGSWDNTRSYNLFGLDVIFDPDLNPSIIEVNATPEMTTMCEGPNPHFDVHAGTCKTQLRLATDLMRFLYGSGSCGVKKLYSRLMSVGARFESGASNPSYDSMDACREDGEERWRCVDEEDLAIFMQSSCERERCLEAGGWRACGWIPAYPVVDGERYDEWLAHLAHVHGVPVDSRPSRTSWRLHHIQTTLRRAEEEEEHSKS